MRYLLLIISLVNAENMEIPTNHSNITDSKKSNENNEDKKLSLNPNIHNKELSQYGLKDAYETHISPKEINAVKAEKTHQIFTGSKDNVIGYNVTKEEDNQKYSFGKFRKHVGNSLILGIHKSVVSCVKKNEAKENNNRIIEVEENDSRMTEVKGNDSRNSDIEEIDDLEDRVPSTIEQ